MSVTKFLFQRCSSTNGTVSLSRMMWCWSYSPSFWLGGKHGSSILEWWWLHPSCSFDSFLISNRSPWRQKRKRSGEPLHSDEIILKMREPHCLLEEGREECLPGTSFDWNSMEKITTRGVKISLSPKESFLVSIFCRYVEGSTLYEGSVRNFYSPFESPEASDDDEEVGKLVCHV